MNTSKTNTGPAPRAINLGTARDQQIAWRQPIDEKLEELCRRFRDEAMALDPTVTGCWIAVDHLDHPRAVMGVMLSREAR